MYIFVVVDEENQIRAIEGEWAWFSYEDARLAWQQLGCRFNVVRYELTEVGYWDAAMLWEQRSLALDQGCE